MRASKDIIRVGNVYQTKSCGDIEVLEYYNSKHIVVRFSDGNTKISAAKEIRTGSIKNNFQPSVYGVGYRGEGKYFAKISKEGTQEYSVWSGMLRRCYDAASLVKRPTYESCTVCSDWHNFQNFAEWYTNQRGYFEGWHLDKDLTVLGNKVYAPETCALIPPEVNSLFTGSKESKDEYPTGIHFCETKQVFIVQCCSGSGQQYHGQYYSLEKAFSVYRAVKEKRIKEVANKYKEVLPDAIYNNLINYSVEMWLR